LENKAGVYLFQLPPNLKVDLDRLQKFLGALPSDGNVAFEFRHPSWFTENVFSCLWERNYALCVSETDDGETADLVSTANWGYLRLRRSSYDHADLVRWKERILAQPWDQAYLSSNMKMKASAPSSHRISLHSRATTRNNHLLLLRNLSVKPEGQRKRNRFVYFLAGCIVIPLASPRAASPLCCQSLSPPMPATRCGRSWRS
jgi:uncharacterized protein YecE (DUF72 family)